jgi:hypothetical protein
VIDEDTKTQLPTVPRPENGFAAWQATLGYINRNHCPDARMVLKIYPISHQIRYGARVLWGPVVEEVWHETSIPDAMATLWSLVDQNYQIFATPHESRRSPTGYNLMEWFDLNTQDVLHRLIWTAHRVFGSNWKIVLFYRTFGSPPQRVQMRLLARDNTVIVGGRGPNVIHAARNLFHNAADIFAFFSGT